MKKKKRFPFDSFYRIMRSSQAYNRRFTRLGRFTHSLAFIAFFLGIDTRRTFTAYIAFLAIALLLAAMLFNRYSRMSFEAKRDLPRFGTVDETVQYTLRVKNQTDRYQTGLVAFEDLRQTPLTYEELWRGKHNNEYRRNWFDDRVGYPRWLWMMRQRRGANVDEHVVPPMPPHGEVDVTVDLIPIRRGYLHFDGTTLAAPDPFNIRRRLFSEPAPDKLLILPKRYPVPNVELSGRRRYQQGGVNLAMSVGDSMEFMSLRDYRPGDPLRHVHWKSWAKRGEPIVKEYQDEFFVRHALILDTFADDSNPQVFEDAVSVAASFACHTFPQDALLDFLFVGPQAFCFTSGRGLAHLDRILEILACVESCNDKPFGDLLPLVRQHVDNVSGCICILLQWDEQRQELVEWLRHLGVPLVLILISDEERPDVPSDVHVLASGEVEAGLAELRV
ncbi:MAG: DUF58 domain-containing protein [Pseudomonadota bacterium]